MSLPERKRIDTKILVSLGIACILIFFAVYYAEHREVKSAYTLAGRTLEASGDVSSYQFDIQSNISMMEESFSLIRGNGSVDYSNENMAVRLRSMADSIDFIVVNGTAYLKNGDTSWETKKLNQKMWSSYDQLTTTNLLLANSTNLSMEKTDAYFILTAFPDNNALIAEAEKAGLQLKGDERLNEYYIRYLIEKKGYRIISIESHIEFMMNIQGLMSPVTINNRVDVYNYNAKIEIEAPPMKAD
ncbi:hypothetical protein [Methanolobus psychrotolerans]|uniref:hypothetical protein n=1 Tax=Methanolobus psychrotolerans TaxID=1874706 RepID=UPI000B91BAED|nr:hypothetical protein [Methanolobus psychrotolerans]